MDAVEIVVPRHLHDRLKQLAQLNQETNGVFLYTPRVNRGKTSWHVHSFVLTGIGTAEHVRAHPSRVSCVNSLIFDLHRKNPAVGWAFAKVHTHCRATGQEWFDKFSQGDHESVRSQLSANPNYALLMYSPTHHLAIGHLQKRFNLRVVDSTPAHRRNSAHLEKLAERLQRQRGLPQIRFEATVSPRRR